MWYNLGTRNRPEGESVASIIYQTNRKTGAKYAYSQESYWDKSKGQPRSRRTYLGRVDPETGEIIPKRTKATGAAGEANAGAAVATGDASEVERLRARVAELEAALERLSADALAVARG